MGLHATLIQVQRYTNKTRYGGRHDKLVSTSSLTQSNLPQPSPLEKPGQTPVLQYTEREFRRLIYLKFSVAGREFYAEPLMLFTVANEIFDPSSTNEHYPKVLNKTTYKSDNNK